MIRLDVSTLSKAGLGTSATLRLDVGSQTLGELEVDFLRGTLEALRVQGGILIQGTVEARLELECVRCLEVFSQSVLLDVEEIFRLADVGPTPDLPYAMDNDGRVDLAPLMRELTWIAIPLKPICRPDCRGLCPHCGANLNHEICHCQDEAIDPHWGPLQDLLSQRN